MFVHHDITKFSLMSSREGGYNVITCASAVPLLEDPGEAFEQWAAFLILAGAWYSTSNREVPYLGVAFRASRHSCWRCPPWGGLRVTGTEYLKTFVREARLGVGKRFGSKGYAGAEVWEGSDGGKVFDRFVEGPVGAMIGLGRGMGRRERWRGVGLRRGL